jgi:hypothetical protein
MHDAAKSIVGGVGGCASCAQQASLGSARVWYLGQNAANGYAGPGFNMKTDITAGVAAFALPLGYHLWAPKKWKRLNPIMNIAAVIATYIGVVWVMRSKA